MTKANILGLALTAKQWGLRQGGDTPWERTTLNLVADALNQALREAATVVQDELGSREGGASPSLRGSALMAIIVRALYDKWVDVAEQHKKHGAADSRVRERAAVALRNLFIRPVDKQEEVGMKGLLQNLEEGFRGRTPGDAQKDMQRALGMLDALTQLDLATGKDVNDFIESDQAIRQAYLKLMDGRYGLKDALTEWIRTHKDKGVAMRDALRR